jgi:predicted alpha/beta-fold hydrolase
MPRRVALLLLAVATSACALRPLPPPRPVSCAVTDAASLWQCVGRPDTRDEESGFAGTMRVVWGDIVQRYKNQRPNLSCDREPRPGYTRIELHSGSDRAPLRAFFAHGDPSKPIIFVLHGLFDSNADLYVMRAADALMRQHYGVVVPDLRWHGCLLADEWLSTLDLEEARDLIAWGQRIRAEHPNRPIGLAGFSMGGLNAIAALSQPESADVFDAGAIAISPPADLSSLIAHLNEPASLHEGRSAIFHFSFRTHLHARMKALHVDDRHAPFTAYLTYLLAHWPNGSPPSSVDAFITAAEPSTRLSSIRRPLLIITAPDDPVLGESSSRTLIAAADGLPYVNVLTTADGGHIGHLGRYAQWLADTFDRFFTNAASFSLREKVPRSGG